MTMHIVYVEEAGGWPIDARGGIARAAATLGGRCFCARTPGRLVVIFHQTACPFHFAKGNTYELLLLLLLLPTKWF